MTAPAKELSRDELSRLPLNPILLLDNEYAALRQMALAYLDCKEDAERYLWLRDKSPGQFEQPIVVTQARSANTMKYVGPLAYKDLDAAIDAARSAAKEKK